MAETTYNYTISTGTANGIANADRLAKEIADSTIIVALERIDTDGDSLDVVMKDALSTGDQTTLNGLVTAHTGDPLNPAFNPTDSDGSPIIQPKAAPAGWAYQLHVMELTTCTLAAGGVLCEKFDGSDFSFITTKHYKMVSGVETEWTPTDQADLDVNCVMTDFYWMPDHDYRIIGAAISQKSIPGSSVRLWARGVPQYAKGSGGSVDFSTGGYNFEYLPANSNLNVDGRVAKTLKYTSAAVRTNEFALRFRHGAGVKHGLQLSVDLFVPPGF